MFARSATGTWKSKLLDEREINMTEVQEVMPKNIDEAIVAIMNQVGYVQKMKAANLTYTFAGEAALIAAIRPWMVHYGVYVRVTEVTEFAQLQYETANGKPMLNTTLRVTMRFTHAPSGSFIDVDARGEGSDSGDKSSNKALTGAYKYALRQTFCIETGDDPDKDASEQYTGTKQANAAKANGKPNGKHTSREFVDWAMELFKASEADAKTLIGASLKKAGIEAFDVKDWDAMQQACKLYTTPPSGF